MKNKEHETFELTEDVFAKWDEENEKWYNKYCFFLIYIL